MGPLSYLTAVDTSLEHDLSPVDHTNNLVAVSNDEVDRVIRLWKETAGRGAEPVNPYQELYRYLHPLVIGALDRASSLSLMLCREILGYHMKDKKKAEQISRQLNSSYPAHQYPITSREARRLGLRVKDLDPGTDALLQELNLLYSEMGQRAITDYDEPTTTTTRSPTSSKARACRCSTRSRKTGTTGRKSAGGCPMNDVSVLVPLPEEERQGGQVEVPHSVVLAGKLPSRR